MAEDTYPVRASPGRKYPMTREMIRYALDSDLPGGMECLFHTSSYSGTSVEDFFAACRHFGLDHLLFDIRDAEVDAELEARRARGAPPTARELPFAARGEGDRERADAMLDAYERRVADAEAMAAARAAPGGPARRPAARAARSRLSWPPAGPGEKAYNVGSAGSRVMVTRATARRVLGLVVPHGLAYMYYHLHELDMNPGDFMSVCRGFGLGHLIFDVPIREVLAELEARRARGAPPTARELPLMMGEEDREYADAMLDVHARKAAEAEAAAALRVAPAAA